MTELEALITLNQLPKIGPIRIRSLLDRFGSATDILTQNLTSLTSTPGIGPETAHFITHWEKHSDTKSEISLASQREIQIICQKDPSYPATLRQFPDAPVILYVWGNILPEDTESIGIVGSRKLTHYGRESARKLSFQLAGAGLTIISGLARGIDTAAHEGALAAYGRTIAVIGSGLLQIYPSENIALCEKITNGQGAIISEFPLKTPPSKQTFPQRNRIVAHWSQGLLVVECPKRSGSLITANLASEAGRTVYAVPGPIDRPTSAGCHELIRDGATLITDGSQILDDYGFFPIRSGNHGTQPCESGKQKINLPEDEQTLLQALCHEQQHIDELALKTTLSPSLISVLLMKLELKRLVSSHPGQRYSIRHS